MVLVFRTLSALNAYVAEFVPLYTTLCLAPALAAQLTENTNLYRETPRPLPVTVEREFCRQESSLCRLVQRHDVSITGAKLGSSLQRRSAVPMVPAVVR